MELTLCHDETGARKDNIKAVGSITPTFFGKLSSEASKALFERLLDLMAKGDQALRIKTLEVLKSIQFDVNLVVSHLDSFTIPQKEEMKKKSKTEDTSDVDLAGKIDRMEVMLEIFNYKENFTTTHIEKVLKALFNFLNKMLQLEAPPNYEDRFEYILQLSLTGITQMTKNMEQNSGFNLQDGYIDNVIQCLRTSKNPQTQNQAILLLASAAPKFPKKILGQIIPLFTFMGASTVRQDDNYTFYVLQKAIEQILPMLLANGIDIVQVLKIFVNSLPNIPSPRRVVLFTIISKTTSVEYLFKTLALLLAKHVDPLEEKPDSEKLELVDHSESSISTLCHRICEGFPPYDVITSFVSLWEKLPNVTQEIARKVSPILRHQIIEFISDHIASKPFLDTLLNMELKEYEKTQASYLSLFETLLQALQMSTEKTTTNEIWKETSKSCYNCLDNLNQLLSIGAFVHCITKLLQHNDPQIRRRALILFNDRITNDKEVMSKKEVEVYMKMLDALLGIIDSKDNTPELDVNKQSALLSIEILARNFAKTESDPFVKTLPAITKCIQHPNSQVIASALLCLASVCGELQALAVPSISKFFPLVLKAVEGSFAGASADVSKNRQLLQLSALSALEVFIQHLHKFLSPYFTQIIVAVTNPMVVDSKNEKIVAKSKSICEQFTKIAGRLLFPSIFVAYKPSMRYQKPESLVWLLEILRDTCSKMNFATTESNHKKLLKFFLMLFDYRNTNEKHPENQVDRVEQQIITSFMGLAMKLNEQLFKPTFLKIIEWAHAGAEEEAGKTKEAISKSLFFYKLVDRTGDTLKSIFVPYYGYFLDNIIRYLNAFSTEREEETENSLENSMLQSLISSLYKCFLYDTESFINKDKFDNLLIPLVNQLENTRGSEEQYDERMEKFLIPALVQLAVCVGNETFWKPLNYQVLLKTRSESPKVRYAALRVVQECYIRLGEDLLVLLPETIPFLSELMEDSDPKVEHLCQEVINTMEKYLGTESISALL